MTKRVRVATIIAYIVAALAVAVGLALIALNLAGEYMSVGANDITRAQDALISSTGIPMNYMHIGIVVLIAGSLVTVATLVVEARLFDKENDKQMRKELRQQKMNEALANNVETPIVEAEVRDENGAKSPDVDTLSVKES